MPRDTDYQAMTKQKLVDEIELRDEFVKAIRQAHSTAADFWILDDLVDQALTALDEGRL